MQNKEHLHGVFFWLNIQIDKTFIYDKFQNALLAVVARYII